MIRSNPKILFACNKSDESLADTVENIQKSIEKELSVLKETRTSLEVVGEENQEQNILGTPGEPFKFEIDCPLEYSFISCSAKENKLEEVKEFIYTIIN